MIPYALYFFSLFSLSVLEIFLKRKYQPIILTISFILYQLFFGFRGFVGWDVINYYAHYKYGEHDTFEFGYTAIVNIFQFFQLDFHIFILFLTCIQGILLYLFFKRYSSYLIFSLFICISITSMNLQIETLRHSFLLLIFLNSLHYIRLRKIVPFTISMILGFLFHQLAIILYTVYFLYGFFFNTAKNQGNIRVNRIYIVLGLGFILFSLNISIIHLLLELINLVPIIRDYGGISKLNYYTRVKYFTGESSLVSLKFIFFLILSIPILIYRKKIKLLSANMEFFYNLFLISWVVYFYTAGIMVVWFRLYLLTFTFPIWILIPALIGLVNLRKKIIFLIMYSVLCFFRIYHTLDSYPYLEYRNILFQDDFYENRRSFIEVFDENRGLLDNHEF